MLKTDKRLKNESFTSYRRISRVEVPAQVKTWSEIPRFDSTPGLLGNIVRSPRKRKTILDTQVSIMTVSLVGTLGKSRKTT
jgi:hypothetical protein